MLYLKNIIFMQQQFNLTGQQGFVTRVLYANCSTTYLASLQTCSANMEKVLLGHFQLWETTPFQMESYSKFEFLANKKNIYMFA